MRFFRKKAPSPERTAVLKCAQLIIVALGFTAFACNAEETPSQKKTAPPQDWMPAPLHMKKDHDLQTAKTPQQSPGKPSISAHISNAFNQRIQRNLNLLLNAKLAPGNTGPTTNASYFQYFQQKTKNQQTFISPTLGFRYRLTPRLSLSAETEIGYFKLSGGKWYDINYHPPDGLLTDSNGAFFHTDTGIQFRF